jgi:hypothetical protein
MGHRPQSICPAGLRVLYTLSLGGAEILKNGMTQKYGVLFTAARAWVRSLTSAVRKRSAVDGSSLAISGSQRDERQLRPAAQTFFGIDVRGLSMGNNVLSRISGA